MDPSWLPLVWRRSLENTHPGVCGNLHMFPCPPHPAHAHTHSPFLCPDAFTHSSSPRVCLRTSLCSLLGEICLWQSRSVTLTVQKKRCRGDGGRASNLQQSGKERMLTCSIICACALTPLTPLALFSVLFCRFPSSFFPLGQTCLSEMIDSPETLVAPLPSTSARTAGRRTHASKCAARIHRGSGAATLLHACMRTAAPLLLISSENVRRFRSDPPTPPPPSLRRCLPLKVAKLTP